MEVIIEHSHYRSDRCVSRTLSQTVYRGVYTLDAGFDRRHSIRHGEVVIVVAVEIEVDVRIALYHHPAETVGLVRIEDSKGVREHNAPDRAILEGIHHTEDIVRRVLHSV